ncbi:MAG: hypothetical protein IPP91_11170 [Betaproteobacteria bacterium]|nr:hypothetical protein [Betaproteobacteria bacterium]
MELKVGDILEWDERAGGRMALKSRLHGAVHVYAQNWDCSQQVARLQIS